VSVPSTPSLITATPADSQVELTWQAPISDGGAAITGYVITTSFGYGAVALGIGSYGGLVSTTTVGTVLTTTVSNLTNGLLYTFQVAAVNADGTSANSSVLVTSPVLGTVTPPPDVPPPSPSEYPGTQDISTKAGHVIVMFLQDIDTGAILQITPSRGGLWLRDFDPGYPDPREVVSSYPDRDGTLDLTRYVGARAATVSVAALPSADTDQILSRRMIASDDGTYPASCWADTLASWCRIGRRVRLFYQLRGLPLRAMVLRPSQLGAPVSGSGTGRYERAMQVSWRVPDGMIFELPSTEAADPVSPDRTLAGIPLGNTPVDGISFGTPFPLTPEITFSGSTSTPSVRNIAYPGTMPSYPIVRVRGGCTSPGFSISDNSGIRASMDFSGNGGLVIGANEYLEVDTANRTAMRFGAGGVGTDVRAYLIPPVPWKSWRLEVDPTESTGNVVRFTGTSATGAVGEVSYRTNVI
jgi:hypothetical protein